MKKFKGECIMANTLGSRISENRKRKNITQDHLAEQMGVSTQAVSKWENDISCPDISLLPMLADYFNTSIDELMRGENARPVQLVPEGERKEFDKMMLKMSVLSAQGDIVNMNLPLILVKAAIESGIQMINISGNSEALKNVDFKAVLLAAEKGIFGKLMEVKSASGDLVEIYIE
jgi:transcriptional regulator with XRE-family HTH domain